MELSMQIHIIIIVIKLIIMMMMMMMMMTMIIIIIALKGAIRDFYNLLTAPRTVSNMYAHVARVRSCANHVQHIERVSRVTFSVPFGTKGQLSY